MTEMPMYVYRCMREQSEYPRCPDTTERHRIGFSPENSYCPHCSELTRRIFTPPQLITRPTRLQDVNRFNEVFYPGMTEAQIAEERKREDAEYEANWANTTLPERRNEKPDEMTLMDLPMTDQAADKETMKWLEG